jgi:LysM domain.
MDNDLPAYCAKFPKKGSLCIKNKCDVYTVQSGDTCTSVSAAHNISAVQLRSYNPWIDSGCYNFNRTIDTQICINEPGQKYVPPATTTSVAGSTASSAVPVPSDVAANTTTRCGEYYKVGKGEECDVFTAKFGISRGDFGILNPEVNVKYV